MVLLKVTFDQQKRVRLAQGLWLMSWLAVLGGVLTFVLGVYLKYELLKRDEVMDNDDVHAVPNILILVGLAAVGANVIAGKVCQDSLDSTRFPAWKKYLLPWFCTVALLCLLLLSVFICSYALQGRLEDSLKEGLRNGIKYYKDTDVPGRCFQKETIDRLQMELRCCGNTNFKDWFEVQWVSNRYLDFTNKDVKDRVRSNVDGRYLVDGVPFSCCNPASPRPCIQMAVKDNSAHFNYDYHNEEQRTRTMGKALFNDAYNKEELNLHFKGCRQALVDYYMSIMNTIGPGIISVMSLQLTVLVSLRYLETSVENASALENPEGESDGWILKNSVKETLEEVHQKCMVYLKKLQGQVGEEEVKLAEATTDATLPPTPASAPAPAPSAPTASPRTQSPPSIWPKRWFF